MIDKVVPNVASAVVDIIDGSTILVSGFGGAGRPHALLTHLADLGLKDLTIISNNAGAGRDGLALLFEAGSVRKLVASYPRSPDGAIFDHLYERGEVELELVPQGTLSERIRAAGAGIGGFFTPTGADTDLAAGKETRVIDGRLQVLELPLHADFALLRAERGDRWGNLVYDKSQRNYGPTMAMAAKTTIVEVAEVVPLGSLDPQSIVTPGVFVDRVVKVPS